MTIEKIKSIFFESVNVKNKLLAGNELKVLVQMGDEISNSIQNGSKLLLCGNGGSAADAQHLAAEMLVRLRPSNNQNLKQILLKLGYVKSQSTYIFKK